jgi:hypothetical protein
VAAHIDAGLEADEVLDVFHQVVLDVFGGDDGDGGGGVADALGGAGGSDRESVFGGGIGISGHRGAGGEEEAGEQRGVEKAMHGNPSFDGICSTP